MYNHFHKKVYTKSSTFLDDSYHIPDISSDFDKHKNILSTVLFIVTYAEHV